MKDMVRKGKQVTWVGIQMKCNERSLKWLSFHYLPRFSRFQNDHCWNASNLPLICFEYVFDHLKNQSVNIWYWMCWKCNLFCQWWSTIDKTVDVFWKMWFIECILCETTENDPQFGPNRLLCEDFENVSSILTNLC